MFFHISSILPLVVIFNADFDPRFFFAYREVGNRYRTYRSRAMQGAIAEGREQEAEALPTGYFPIGDVGRALSDGI